MHFANLSAAVFALSLAFVFSTRLTLAQTTSFKNSNGKHKFQKTHTDSRDRHIDYLYTEKGTKRNLSNFEITKVLTKETYNMCHKSVFLSAFGRTIMLCLTHFAFENMFSPDFKVSVHDEFSERKEHVEPNSFQVYKGIVNNKTDSIVYGKINGNNQFDGYFMLDKQYYFIEPLTNFNSTIETDLCIVYHSNGDKTTNFKFDTTETEEPTGAFLKHNLKASRKFSKEVGSREFRNNKSRTKRSVSSISCTVNLVADHTFYKHVGRESVGDTISELVYRLGDADVIFRGTDFNGDGYGDNIGFQISKITIYKSKASYLYALGDESLNVYDYLDTFSQYNFDPYCLAMAFTYRDFDGGILGLAWVGSSSFYGNAGGICQRQIIYSKDRKLYSLNTAVVTKLNYGEPLLSYNFGLVIAHEFGHNFGSSHDPFGDNLCSPDNGNGNYIMYAYASEGSKPNHNKFSTCSINYMYPVIRNKGWCFTSYSGPSCGNFIVEPGEECDCGDDSTCSSIDPCCSPRSDTISLDPPCTLRRSYPYMYQCSAKNSPCCTSECKFISNSTLKICRPSSECQFVALCNGTSAKCPKNENRLDGTLCDSGRKLCSEGVCAQSICNKFNLDLCKCSGTPENECLICCKFSNSSQCLPASSFAIHGNNGGHLYIKPGEGCNSVNGFCDDRGKCISNEDVGAMENIFSKDTADEIKIWFENYWYYFLAGIVTLSFLIFVFVLTKKKPENIQVDAFRLGRLEHFMNSAEIEIKRQEERLKQMEIDFDERVKTVEKGNRSTSYVKAVGRLTTLFPTTPSYVITDIVKKSSSEIVAVRLLLMKGFPVRKFLLNEPPKSEISS